MKNESKRTDNAKKSLITEKITGRKLTPDRILRLATTAAVCGIAFGLCASLTFCGVQAINRRAEAKAESEAASIAAAEAESRAAAESMAESIAEEERKKAEAESEAGVLESQEETGTDGETAADGANESAAAGTENTDPTPNANGVTTPGAVNPTGSPIPGGGATTEQEIMNRFVTVRRSSVEAIRECLVKVNVVSTEETWFEGAAENTETFSGLILDVDPKEILILTTADAAASEKRRVLFANGTTIEAYVKQVSTLDKLAVLAISPENGIGPAMLENLKCVEFAGIDSIASGTPVIAAGAPLGAADSYTFGDVGFVNPGETGIDSEQMVFYADLKTDAKHGTFVMDYNGKLAGIAADAGENVPVDERAARIISIGALSETIRNLKEGKKQPYAGITGITVDFDMRYNGIPEGMYIRDVAAASPAYEMAIRRGDIVQEINGKPVEDVSDYLKEIYRCQPGDGVVIKGKRAAYKGDYYDIEFTFTLGER